MVHKKSYSTTMDSRVEALERKLQESEAQIQWTIDETAMTMKVEFITVLRKLYTGSSSRVNHESGKPDTSGAP